MNYKRLSMTMRFLMSNTCFVGAESLDKLSKTLKDFVLFKEASMVARKFMYSPLIRKSPCYVYARDSIKPRFLPFSV